MVIIDAIVGNYKTLIEKYNKEVFSIVYIFLLIHFFWGTTMIQNSFATFVIHGFVW